MKGALLLVALLVFGIDLTAQMWSADYATAQQTAAQEGKRIVLVFSGSDWCAPCIKLDREIWQDTSFQRAAAADFVFYRADFPRKKEHQLSEAVAQQNAQLADRYNARGAFPLVVVLDAEGNLLGQTGYQKITPTDYLAILEGFAQ